MHRHKAKRKVEAVILLQTWWRLLLMRHKGKQKGPLSSVSMDSWGCIRKFCWRRRGKRTADATQIEGLEANLHRKFRLLVNYLEPLEGSIHITDVIQSQNRLKKAIFKVKRLICGLNLSPLAKHRRSSLGSDTPRSLGLLEGAGSASKRKSSKVGKNIKDYVKARAKVHHRVLDRAQKETQRLKECLVGPA